MRELRRYIDDNIGYREAVVLGGDFNDWHGGLGRLLESQLDMTEAFRSLHGSYAKTFPSHWPMLRMDRIYFRNIRLVSARCLERRPWSDLSDHLPLFARFALA